MHSKHGNARGSGGMPPRKILKNRCPDIGFGVFWRVGWVYYVQSFQNSNKILIPSYLAK